MKFTFALLVLITCLVSNANAQNDTTTAVINKNTVYVNGTFCIVCGGVSGAYERVVKQNMWDKNIRGFVKVGLGQDWGWGLGGPHIMPQVGIITGTGKKHFEAGAGIVMSTYGIGSWGYILPHVTVGYRRQKPGDSFLVRWGASFPEGAYIGIGTSF